MGKEIAKQSQWELVFATARACKHKQHMPPIRWESIKIAIIHEFRRYGMKVLGKVSSRSYSSHLDHFLLFEVEHVKFLFVIFGSYSVFHLKIGDNWGP